MSPGPSPRGETKMTEVRTRETPGRNVSEATEEARSGARPAAGFCAG